MFINGIINNTINHPNYINGQAGKYRRLRINIKKYKIPCECGSTKNVDIHHKEKVKYGESYSYPGKTNMNNDDDNILFLCNSCHQKVHYRELDRKHKVKHNPKNGRFVKNV